MDKIRFFFIALLGMGAAHLSVITPSLLTCKVLIKLIIKKESIYGITALNWLMD